MAVATFDYSVYPYVPYETKWSILAEANTFNPVAKIFRLCFKEVFFILFKPETASLNARSEVLVGASIKNIEHWLNPEEQFF